MQHRKQVRLQISDGATDTVCSDVIPTNASEAGWPSERVCSQPVALTEYECSACGCMPLWSPATIHFWMVVKLRFEFSEERFTAIGAKESWNPRELRAVLAQFDLLRLVTTKVTVSSRNAEFYETVCVRCEHPIDIDHPICGGCKFVPLWNADAVYGWFWINWDHNLSDSESASLRSQEFWNPGELYDRLTSLQLWPEVELIC